MIKVKIIALGKLKEDYLKSAVSEYSKRLFRFCDFEIIELSPKNLPDSPSDLQIESALLSEAELINSKIPKGFFVAALCVEGKRMSSEVFAEKINELSDEGKNICFIIGSSYGMHKTIKEKADLKLSLSDMTFPHQLFRVMLTEQIYRAFMINGGSTYHK